MGAARLTVVHGAVGGTPPRASHLPLRPRTAPAASSESLELAREGSRRVLAAIAAAGLCTADLAAVWDCSETRVRAKLDPTATGAPITLVDVLRLRGRAPAVWAALVGEMAASGAEGAVRP